ncbi:MAG: NTP transferase domain-containing protein [Halieaceae bacterium]
MDTILLAGNGSGSRLIRGEHKSFLVVAGIPLLIRAIAALERVEAIEKICVIGPRDRILALIQQYAGNLQNNKDTFVLEQKDDLYQNCMHAFVSLIPGYEEGVELNDAAIFEKPVLLVASDLPLLCAAEVEEFLAACGQKNLDYCVGMTEEKHLKRFEPSKELPGFNWNYLHLVEGNYRLNNLHLIKPFKVGNRIYLEKLYQRRHQKSLMNIAATFYDFAIFEKMGFMPVVTFLLMELCVLCRHLGLEPLVNLFRRFSSKARLSRYAGKLLKAKVEIVCTTLGGSAADIDSEDDLAAVERRLIEWTQ